VSALRIDESIEREKSAWIGANDPMLPVRQHDRPQMLSSGPVLRKEAGAVLP
jgi:hypothetical protein